MIDFDKDGTASSAPNGFTRYTLDVSHIAGLDIWLIISGGGHAPSLPADPFDFSVDNFQIIPEPASMMLLVAGGAALLRRRRK